MEGRIRNLLLSAVYVLLMLSSTLLYAIEIEAEQGIKPVIQPEIARLDFKESRIDTNNFEVIASTGILSIEDFGVNTIYGFKVAYRVSEGFFVDTELGASTAGRTSAELFFSGTSLLSDEQRNLQYYIINLGYDVFPGETFVTDGLTYNTAMYLVAGLGNTKFAGESHFTFSWGFGYRVLLADFMSVYFDVRDHAFRVNLLEDKLTQNIEISLGVGFYF